MNSLHSLNIMAAEYQAPFCCTTSELANIRKDRPLPSPVDEYSMSRLDALNEVLSQGKSICLVLYAACDA